MSCPQCADGPKGIEGHKFIGLDDTAPPKSGALFRCVLCGESYHRMHESGNTFVWVRMKPVTDAPGA